MIYYAGIGSRRTPTNILGDMSRLASELENLGWTLRSGGAGGADTAFSEGVKEKAQIWLPWEGFVENPNPNHEYRTISKDDQDAIDSVNKYHPDPSRLTDRGWLLMMRNHRQLFGLNEPDSEFIICWTPKGEIKGGTGQNLRSAKDKGMKVYNMFSEHWEDILNKIKFEYE